MQTNASQDSRLSSYKLSASILLFFICLGLFLNDIFKGFWDHDSGFYFMQSSMMASGLKPYIDFSTIYPPIYNAINAIPIYLGIDRWLLIWLIPFLWVTASSGLSYLYWKKCFPKQASHWPWLVAALFPLFCIDFGGNHNTLELGVVCFGVGALVVSQENGDKASFFTGTLIGLAFLSKQVGILLLLPFLSQCRTRRSSLALLAGTSSSIVLTLAWLNFDTQAILQSYTLLQSYVAQSSSSSMVNTLFDFAIVIYIDIFRTPPGVFFFVFIFAITCIAGFTTLKQKQYRQFAWIFSWFIVCICFLGARAINNFPHYTLNCWPAILALLAAALPHVNPKLLKTLAITNFSVASLFLVFFYPKINALPYSDGRYFARWADKSEISEFLYPVAMELKKHIPANASIAQIGTEENVLLFLADRMQINKNWMPDTRKNPIVGDYIIFTDDDSSDSSRLAMNILGTGYEVARLYQFKNRRIALFVKKTS